MRELKRAILFLLLWPFVVVFSPVGFIANLIWEALRFGYEKADEAFAVYDNTDHVGSAQKKCTLPPGHRISDNPECKDHP